VTVLSRLRLNPRSRYARHDLGDCEEMHRTVMAAFPPDAGPSPRRRYNVLYRVDVDNRGNPCLLSQSSVFPDWGHLRAGYLVGAPESKNVEAVYERLVDGQRLTFRLRANPTKRLFEREDTGKPGKRVDLRREEDRLEWLGRRATANGFALVDAQVRPALEGGKPLAVANVAVASVQRVTGSKEGGSARITFGSVLFEGLLEVTDRVRFLEALNTGIGPGRAYGFGLLSIAPA
jgi:CRISPR system Cascade subunit CasE